MSFTSRLSEKWFKRGLWLISFIFFLFLIGLGGNLIKDLPKVTNTLSIKDFIDQKTEDELNAKLTNTQKTLNVAYDELNTSKEEHNAATRNHAAALKNFENWVKTREATKSPQHDQELFTRTRELERLQQHKDNTRKTYEQRERISNKLEADITQINKQIAQLEQQAKPAYDSYKRITELKIFLYRLALTLPLLVLAGFLFIKYRKCSWWPFVWGFIWFALFTFFVELVPYLPNYGGYVRYSVGIIVTLIIGRAVIISLNKYLAEQKTQESLPEQKRREELSKQLDYDKTLTRLSQGVCPGCERQVNNNNQDLNFCPHCGIALFEICSNCNKRKNAFTNFCFSCGLAK